MIKWLIFGLIFPAILSLANSDFESNSSPIWPFSDRLYRSTEGSNSKDFRYVVDPNTGQRFRKKPIVNMNINRDPGDRISNEAQKPENPDKNANKAEGMMADRREKAKDYVLGDYESFPDYGQPSVVVHPPFLKEHLVTAHIRPVWSSPRQPNNFNQNQEQLGGQKSMRNPNPGPSSIVNIYIVTPQNGNNVPEIQVTNKKEGGFVIPIIKPTTESQKIKNSAINGQKLEKEKPNPFYPFKSFGTKITDGDEDDRSPARSGSGLLDTRRLTIY